MHFLWKNKLGISLSKEIQEIFKAFEDGQDPAQLKNAVNKQKEKIKENIKQQFDLTNFNVNKLVIEQSSLTIEEDDENEFLVNLELIVQQFIYNGHITDTEMLFFGYVNSKELELMLGEGYSISPEEEGWDASIYIEAAHNIAVLRFLKVNADSNLLNIDIEFDFETNRTGFTNQCFQK